MLRPLDPATGVDTSDKFFGIVRPGGGCNDLAISGHMVVAALTACAWHVRHLSISLLFHIDRMREASKDLKRDRHLRPTRMQMHIVFRLAPLSWDVYVYRGRLPLQSPFDLLYFVPFFLNPSQSHCRKLIPA